MTSQKTTLHYYSMPHYQYLVGILYGAQAMRCHNRSPPQSPSPYVLVFRADNVEMALSSYFKFLNQFLYHYCSIYGYLSYIFYHD